MIDLNKKLYFLTKGIDIEGIVKTIEEFLIDKAKEGNTKYSYIMVKNFYNNDSRIFDEIKSYFTSEGMIVNYAMYDEMDMDNPKKQTGVRVIFNFELNKNRKENIKYA